MPCGDSQWTCLVLAQHWWREGSGGTEVPVPLHLGGGLSHGGLRRLPPASLPGRPVNLRRHTRHAGPTLGKGSALTSTCLGAGAPEPPVQARVTLLGSPVAPGSAARPSEGPLWEVASCHEFRVSTQIVPVTPSASGDDPHGGFPGTWQFYLRGRRTLASTCRELAFPEAARPPALDSRIFPVRPLVALELLARHRLYLIASVTLTKLRSK